MKLKTLLLLLLTILCTKANAQDPIFTQSFLVPETLNPGFTGFANTWHAGLLYRRQWPDGNRRIDTQYGFVNNMVSERAAVGLTVLNHHEVFTNYNYTQINGAYSFWVPFGNEWGFCPAIEVGYGHKNFNFSNLLLEDQININNGSINNGSVDPGVLNYGDKIGFLDISAGFVINSEEAWIGAAVKHLNRPNISFTEYGNVSLDMFLTVHGGYYFNLDSSPSSIFPDDSRLLTTFNYMRQSQYNRIDLGTILELNMFQIGANYSINPERKSQNSHLLTSVNPFAIFLSGEFTFGYSYDLNTSKLGHTQGIHELSITWTSKNTCASCDNYKVKLKRNGVHGYQK